MFYLQKSHPDCFRKDVSVWRKRPCAGSAPWLLFFFQLTEWCLEKAQLEWDGESSFPLRSSRASEITNLSRSVLCVTVTLRLRSLLTAVVCLCGVCSQRKKMLINECHRGPTLCVCLLFVVWTQIVNVTMYLCQKLKLIKLCFKRF